MVPSATPSTRLRTTSSGEGKTHGRHSPRLDAASQARRRPRRNSTRRLPRIVDLLANDLLHLGPQLFHDARDVVGHVALELARPGETDLHVELDAPRPAGEHHDAIAEPQRLAHVLRDE